MYSLLKAEPHPRGWSRAAGIPQADRALPSGAERDEDEDRQHKRRNHWDHHSSRRVSLSYPRAGHGQPEGGERELSRTTDWPEEGKISTQSDDRGILQAGWAAQWGSWSLLMMRSPHLLKEITLFIEEWLDRCIILASDAYECDRERSRGRSDRLFASLLRWSRARDCLLDHQRPLHLNHHHVPLHSFFLPQ